MTRAGRRPRLARGLRHPKTTVRWRLTLLYGGLFLVSGAALLAITYTFVDHATITNAPFRFTAVPGGGAAGARGGPPRPSESRTNFFAAPSGTVQAPKDRSLPPPVESDPHAPPLPDSQPVGLGLVET